MVYARFFFGLARLARHCVVQAHPVQHASQFDLFNMRLFYGFEIVSLVEWFAQDIVDMH